MLLYFVHGALSDINDELLRRGARALTRNLAEAVGGKVVCRLVKGGVDGFLDLPPDFLGRSMILAGNLLKYFC